MSSNMAITHVSGTAIGKFYRNRNIIVIIMKLMNVAHLLTTPSEHTGQLSLIRVLAAQRDITTGEEKMMKTVTLSLCLAASLLSLGALGRGAQAEDASSLSRNAYAQNDRQYSDGPVTEVDYIGVEYGHFAEYIDWLNSTWKPTMEALKKAGLIIDYKVLQAAPKSPDQPNIYLMITLKTRLRLWIKALR